MECSIPEAAECDLSIPIPRGGPIYVPNMVGPSTRVPHFQTSLLFELQVSSLSLFSPLPFFFSFPNLCLFLQNLEAELSEDFAHLDISYGLFLCTTIVFHGSPLIYDDCLCRVDDLKIFTEDQLMDIALKEVFKVLCTCTSPCCFFIQLL